MKDPFDPLDPLLDHLGRQTPVHHEPLAPEIWRRIAQAEAAARLGWWDRIQAVFAQPAFAATFVVACVFLGLFLAEVRRSHRQDEYNRELVKSYLRLIDPLLEAADRKTSLRTGDKS